MQDTQTTSYGSGFNANGGGVFVTRMDEVNGIQIWFFPRNSIPADIQSGTPQPNNWGLPVAAWASGTCDPATHFAPQNLVFDITLCGKFYVAIL